MTTPDPNEPKPHDAAQMLNYRTPPRDKPNYGALGETVFWFLFGILMGYGISFVLLAVFYLLVYFQGNMDADLTSIPSGYVCCLAPASILTLLASLIVRMQCVKAGKFASADTAVIWGIGYILWMPWFNVLANHIEWVNLFVCWIFALWIPGFPIAAAFWLYRRKVTDSI